MKKKKAKLVVGELVEFPTVCYAPFRSGWNGWLFSVAIIKSIVQSKDGRKVVEVEYPSSAYGQQLTNMRGEVVGYGDHKSLTKNVYADCVFSYDKVELHQRKVNEYRRDELCKNCYDVDTEFLIDRGYIKENR